MALKIHVLRPTGQEPLRINGEVCVAVRGDPGGLQPDVQRKYRHNFVLLANCTGFGSSTCDPLIAVIDAYNDDDHVHCWVTQAPTKDLMIKRLDDYDPLSAVDAADRGMSAGVVARCAARKQKFIEEIDRIDFSTL